MTSNTIEANRLVKEALKDSTKRNILLEKAALLYLADGLISEAMDARSLKK